MKTKLAIWLIILIGFCVALKASTQQQVSGGGSMTMVQGGNTAIVTAAGAQKVDGAGGQFPVTGTFWQATQPVSGPLTDAQLRATPVPISGTVTSAMGALVNGAANVGIVRSVPSSCTQATPFSNSTVGVGTGAGTTVTSTSTCVTLVYVNNITNSPVTFRLADKAGTPVIWIGGNADYTIPANSNISFPVNGVLFTGGITAIAGTAAALNLQVNGLQ